MAHAQRNGTKNSTFSALITFVGWPFVAPVFFITIIDFPFVCFCGWVWEQFLCALEMKQVDSLVTKLTTAVQMLRHCTVACRHGVFVMGYLQIQMISARARDRKKFTPTRGTTTMAMFLMWMNQSATTRDKFYHFGCLVPFVARMYLERQVFPVCPPPPLVCDP